jgi:hypothetical protein
MFWYRRPGNKFEAKTFASLEVIRRFGVAIPIRLARGGATWRYFKIRSFWSVSLPCLW